MTNSVTLRQRASTFLGFLILILGSGIGQEQAHPMIFKISVLASGTVLLDGKPIAMNDLAVVLNGKPRAKGLTFAAPGELNGLGSLRHRFGLTGVHEFLGRSRSRPAGTA